MVRSGVVFLSLRNFSNIVISRPGGASDHKKDFKNEKFRQFAIGAVYHFSFWDGLCEKLRLFEVGKVTGGERVMLFEA